MRQEASNSLVEEIEITDELDLHSYLPREVSSLIPGYIDECLRKGFSELRIVHGKGLGVQRRITHACLDRHPSVLSFQLAGEGQGGWGATLVRLRV